MDNKILLFLCIVMVVITLFNFSCDRTCLNDSLQIKNKREKKYVYIDLGANRGDSIYNFLGITEKRTGGSSGGKLSNLVDPNIIKNNKWEIFGFEGNPVFDERLAAMKSDIEAKNKNVQINLYSSTIAWIFDGRIDFFLDTADPLRDFSGTCLYLYFKLK